MNRPEGGGLAGKLDCNPLLYLRAAETLLLLATASGLAVSVKRSLLEQAGDNLETAKNCLATAREKGTIPVAEIIVLDKRRRILQGRHARAAK